LSPDPLTALFISIAALGQRESSDPQDSLQLLAYCEEALDLLGPPPFRMIKPWGQSPRTVGFSSLISHR